jgi:hypothetical protein
MTQPTTNQDIHLLRHRLSAICARVRLILVVRGLLISISMLAALIIGLVLIDYLLRLPAGVRFVTLGVVVYLGVRCWLNYIGPAIRVRITTTDMALQIEQQDPALRGLVANAIELDEQSKVDSLDEINAALTSAALSTVNRRLGERVYPSILNLRDLGKAGLIFAVFAVGISSIGFRAPDLLAIGTSRVLSPWTGTSWPMRFAINDTTDTTPRPIDIAVPIRALIGSSHSVDNASARAVVLWRLLDEENQAINEWTPAMLVPQNRRDEMGIPIYEQLLDTQSVASRHEDASFTLEYRIQTRDDDSAARRISLVRPPELVATVVDITLPAYASALGETELVRSGIVEPNGYDSIISPVLAQSDVTIKWQFSKPISFIGDTAPAWVASLANGNTIAGVTQPEPNTIKLELIAGASVSIEPGVLDEMGIPVRTPIVLGLGVLTDQNPGSSITVPQRDEVVSTHAIIKLQAELSDDFGLSSGSIRANIAQAPGGSSGAPHERIDEGVVLIGREMSADQRMILTHTLDLSAMPVQAGDEVWIEAIAMDLRASASDGGLGITRSPTRVLRVVDDAQLIEQIRSSLSPIRNALRQIDDQQNQLQQMLRDGELSSSRDQRSIANRIEANRRTVEQLQRSVERNTLDDPALESLLNDSASILEEAILAAERASDQIDRGETSLAEDNQRKVRDRIGELLSMLDRGQDSWLALRSVQQLRDELEALRDDTSELNSEIAGQSLDQLTPEQKSALERILERQIASADDAREALSTLDERSKQLEENDPTQAEALRKAAQQGRGAQIEQRLQDAAEQIESNQTSSASQTQSEVLDELNEMLDELENTIRNRDNALRRELASIIDSLKALIGAQEKELLRINDENADDLGDRMIALVGNTLAVRDDALGAFPETRSIADLITNSANAQNDAINALRQAPADMAQATRSEQSSLLHLNSALEEAERLDEQAAQRQAQRLRAELRDAYRESLEIQTALRDESALLVGDRLNRRQRASARALANSQDDVRLQLEEMLEQTQELSDAPVFTLAHAQLDRVMVKSVRGLGETEIERRVITSQSSAIVILSTLVEVLSDTPPNQEPEDFEDGSSGGSEGGASNGGDEPVIPPIAQLKLLRSMQQLAAMQTREYAENPGSANADDIGSLSDLQKQLFEHGRKLIEDLSPDASPSPREIPSGETDEPIDEGPEHSNSGAQTP